jgi:hypothetical protein
MNLDVFIKKFRQRGSILLLAGPLICCGEGLEEQTLQAVLDAGKNISLKPGQVVELTGCLKFRKAGQRIETVGARLASDYARIVHADGSQGPLIDARGIAGATLSKLVLDGNRPGYRSSEGRLPAEPMLFFGGEGAVGQNVSNCIVIGSRSSGGWAAIHINEGGEDIVIRDNMVFSSGVDVRGNGRSLAEKPFGWGDGISTASRNTRIVNNLIYDATDEGIPGTGSNRWSPVRVPSDLIITSACRTTLIGYRKCMLKMNRSGACVLKEKVHTERVPGSG